jgi:hypothetical protein
MDIERGRGKSILKQKFAGKKIEGEKRLNLKEF